MNYQDTNYPKFQDTAVLPHLDGDMPGQTKWTSLEGTSFSHPSSD